MLVVVDGQALELHDPGFDRRLEGDVPASVPLALLVDLVARGPVPPVDPGEQVVELLGEGFEGHGGLLPIRDGF